MARHTITAWLAGAYLLSAAAPSAAQTVVRGSADPPTRAFVLFGGAYQRSSNVISDAGTFSRNVETGRYASRLSLRPAAVVDVGGGVRVLGPLFAALSVSRFRNDEPADLTGNVPHPFFFTQDREIAGQQVLPNDQLFVHIDALAWIPLGRRLDVHVFGGPTIARVRQTFVSEVQFSEEYPYDSATFTGAKTVEAEKSQPVFNAGGAVTFRLNPSLGVTGSVRFISGHADLENAAGDAVKIPIGGLQTGVGVRLAF